MDTSYLKEHLKAYIRLFAPPESQHTAYCKKIGKKYVFGYIHEGVRYSNRVTRQVAISLSVGIMAYQNNLWNGNTKSIKRKRKQK